MVRRAGTGHALVVDRSDRGELAAYLRHWRARVQPGDVGLETGPRRRTPGLRRQEVAQLAGMSVDYYIRLEQGRGPRPSRQMLAAISRALRLSDAERGVLHHLVGESERPLGGPPRDVRPALLHLIERLDDSPAMICDATYEVLAWNSMAAALMGDLSVVSGRERNVVWRFFTRPGVREAHDVASAEQFAQETVADLRAVAARYAHDPGVRGLIDDLVGASAEFRTLWAQREVQVRRSAHKRLHHPVVGWLDLDCDALHDPERDQWVIVHTAAPGSDTHRALQLLGVVGTQDLTARN